MSISIKNKARIIASLAVGGFIALIFIAMGCQKNYGVIEDERVSYDTAVATKTAIQIPINTEPVEPQGIVPTSSSVMPADTIVTYKQAEAAFRARRYTEAVALFTQYTNRKNKNAWGFYMLGLSAKRAGDLDLATGALETATDLDKNHFKGWTNLARVYMDAGESEKALVALEKAIAIESGAKDAYRLKGRALHNQGQLIKAESAYIQALSIDERDYWSMNNLALVYIQQAQYDEALSLLALAIDIKDDEPIFHNNLGMVLENKGQFRAAEQAYSSAVNLDATYTKASINKERVSAVEESSGLASIDLKMLARDQANEMKTWKSSGIEAGE